MNATSTTTSQARWRTVASIFVIALVLRLLVFGWIAHEPRKFYTYDSDGYDRRAINLLTYGQFASEEQPPFTPDLDRTPTYPVFLVAVFATAGHQPWLVALLQILVGSLTAVLAYKLAREISLPHVASVIAGLVVALDPVAAMNSNRILTETLFTFLLVAGLWLLVRYWNSHSLRWALASGLVLALATLTRPINQFLPIALLPLCVLALRHLPWRQWATGVLLFVLVSLVLPYGWAYRNYQEAGIFTLSTIGDTNLAYYRARAVLAEAEGISQDEAWDKIQGHIETTAAAQKLGPSEIVTLQREEAVAIFRRYPMLTLSMFVKGVARIVADPGYTITCTLLDRQSTAFECFPGKSSMNEPGLLGKAFGKLGQMSAAQVLTLAWSGLLLAFVYVSAALGVAQLVRERRWLPLAFSLLLIAYFVGLAAGAESNSRFRIPAMPFVALLAGTGAYTAWIWYGAWQQRRVNRSAVGTTAGTTSRENNKGLSTDFTD